MKIKITKKLVNGESLYLSPGWISNGNWQICKDWIENAALFASEETARAAGLGPRNMRIETLDSGSPERIRDRAAEGLAEALNFRPTGWEFVKHGSNDAAYRSTEGDLLALCNADYANAIGDLGEFVISPTMPDALLVLDESGSICALLACVRAPLPGEPWNMGTWLDTRARTSAAAQIRAAKGTA